jgi:chromosome segregation ATPase
VGVLASGGLVRLHPIAKRELERLRAENARLLAAMKNDGELLLEWHMRLSAKDAEITRLNGVIEQNAGLYQAEMEQLTTLADTRDLMLKQLRAQFDDMVRQRDRALDQGRINDQCLIDEATKVKDADIARLTADIAGDQQRLFHYEATIARLRAEIAEWQASAHRDAEEIEQLKAALQAIADGTWHNQNPYAQTNETAPEFARRKLGGMKNEKP